MSVEIRKAEREDLNKIVKMWYKLATDHQEMMEGYELCDDSKEKWREFVEKGFEKKGMCTFVAETDNGLVGFLNVVIRERLGIFKEKRIGMILDVFVKERERGKGYGSKLIESAEEWIKNKEVKIAVLTVSPRNEKGVDYWEDKGY
ncbi:MAG: GNAT family N-acetyltransferase, partial [Candidatus Thermoplasmatota archaeon]